MAQKTISYLCLVNNFVDFNDFRTYYSKHIAFSKNMSGLFKLVKPSFFSLFIAQIVKNKLKIFIRRSKKYLVLSAVKLVVVYLYNFVVDKDKAINNIEHASQFQVFIFWVHKFHRVEVIDAAVFLNYEASFYQLTNDFIQCWSLPYLLRKKIKQICICWRIF